MRYFNEMDDKYGFADGTTYPDGVELYRDVYIKVVNKLAEKHGSEFRIVPFDRGGVHNYCLWETVPKQWFEEVYLLSQLNNKIWSGVDFSDLPNSNDPEPSDDALDAAISEAMEMDLDTFIEVNPVISSDFQEFLLKGFANV